MSSLLDKDDRAVRIAAGEALALIFEIGSLEKFSGAAKGPSDALTEERSKGREYVLIQGLKAKIISQVRNLSAEAGGKGSVKKDLNNQRNLFRDVLEYFEVLLFVFNLMDISLCVWIFLTVLTTLVGWLLS